MLKGRVGQVQAQLDLLGNSATKARGNLEEIQSGIEALEQ